MYSAGVDQDSEASEIVHFFDGCNVLITGATGYIGKVLVEKLLRSCPSVRLYLLIRSKSGETPTARLKHLLQTPLFHKLHVEQPDFQQRIAVIQGDVGLPDLRLSPTDCSLLQQTTHVIVHGAALTNINANVRRLVETNVRGTKLMLSLAKRMPNLKAFVHLSPVFSHTRVKRVEERFYQPSVGVEKVLSLIELLNDDKLDHLAPILIQAKAKHYPDTYHFSKALSEEAIRLYASTLPICIVRTSIVASTANTAAAGWIDKLGGVAGFMVGVYIGLLHVCQVDADDFVEIVPADYVADFLIAAAYAHSMWVDNVRRSGSESKPVIYNLVSFNKRKAISWRELSTKVEKNIDSCPPLTAFWYRFLIFTKNRYLYNIFQFLFELLPVLVVDKYAVLTGQKPMLRKTYEKLSRSVKSISYCFAQNVKYENKNSLSIWNKLKPIDKKTFKFNIEELDWKEYVNHLVQGINAHYLKNSTFSASQAQVRYKKLKIIHYAVIVTSCALIMYLIMFIVI